MRLLWLCNSIVPSIASQINVRQAVTGGWIETTFEQLISVESIEMVFLAPLRQHIDYNSKNVYFSSFKYTNRYEVSKSRVRYFEEIIERYLPDVIHIWGTENVWCYEMLLASKKCGLINRTVVHIQGLISYYGVDTEHYLAGISNSVAKRSTIRNIILQDNIWKQRIEFQKRGNCEKEALKIAHNIIGRTEWDERCAKLINDSINYYHCDEALRPEFYFDKWQYNKCIAHSIFIPQSPYPLKGFHRIIPIFSEILKKYPDSKIYTTMNDLFHLSMKQKCCESYYQKYLRKLIIKYGLKNQIVFCGRLDAKAMKERMLKSNVVIITSSIENSSNSLCEAMLLGVPIISSEVGGIRSLLDHGIDGFLYPFNEYYLIPSYIDSLFSELAVQERFSKRTIEKAEIRHSIDDNQNRLLAIYSEVQKNESQRL